MTMMINSDINIAVAQFDRLEDPGLKKIASELTAQGVHWYIFDETADREFEIEQLKQHYDRVKEIKYVEENIQI